MIPWLIHLPASIKIGSIFISILLVSRWGMPLGFSIILHSLLLTLLSGTGVAGFSYQLTGLRHPEYWLLIIVIMLILLFTESLNVSGRMERTIQTLKLWFENHTVLLAGLPALVGLLPMPGGAIFSAPFIQSIDSDEKLLPAQKTAINYWFRHIWEFWWPLYPGVIFALHYSKLTLGSFMVLMSPLTLASLAGGYFFILRKLPQSRNSDFQKTAIDSRAILATFLPILLLVVIAIGGSLMLQLGHTKRIYANLIAMIFGLLCSLSIVHYNNPQNLGKSLRIWGSHKTWLMVLIIIGIESFSTTLALPLNTSGETFISAMRDELVNLGVPLFLVIMAIPFISGMITGIAFAFVGASFPLVFGLLGDNPGQNVIAATTILAYTSGYIGMLFSPVHVCFVITAEFFKTRLIKVFPYLIGPAMTVFLTGLVLSGIYYLM